AQVEVFATSGTYLGVLKYRIVDALPSGIAVDNSATANQGRVYVTSGNAEQAGIYAYDPNSQVNSASPPSFGLALKGAGSGAVSVTSDLGGIDCSASCSAQLRAGAAVTLTPVPDPGSSFAGWEGGGCSGTGACTLTIDQATAVEAEFASQLSSSPVIAPGQSA